MTSISVPGARVLPFPTPSVASTERYPAQLRNEGWTILPPNAKLPAAFLERHPNGWPLPDARAVVLSAGGWICIPPGAGFEASRIAQAMASPGLREFAFYAALYGSAIVFAAVFVLLVRG